jgi:hypothetical protein
MHAEAHVNTDIHVLKYRYMPVQHNILQSTMASYSSALLKVLNTIQQYI